MAMTPWEKNQYGQNDWPTDDDIRDIRLRAMREAMEVGIQSSVKVLDALEEVVLSATELFSNNPQRVREWKMFQLKVHELKESFSSLSIPR